MPGLPPGGIMPIMGAPGIGRPPGGMPGMLGCPLGLLAMFIVPNMNCCGGTPAPALAITFFSSPSLPPPFARGCGTPCPLCGGGVDMTHFPLFSIHATLLRVRSLSQSKNASPSSVTQSLASTTSDPFHHPRATPRAARARTRPARAIPSSSASDPSSLAARRRDLPSHDFPPFARVTVARPSHGRAPSTHDRLPRRPRVALARRVVARTRRRRDRSVSDDPPPFASVARFRTTSVDLAVRPRGEGAGKSDERVRGRPRDRRTRRRSEDARARGRAVVLTLGFAPCVRSSVSTGISYSILF